MAATTSYLVVYWCSFGPARRALESHEHPNLISARRELRERGYKHTYGRASKGEVEEYTRTGYKDKPAASVTQLRGYVPAGKPLSERSDGENLVSS